MDWLTGLAKLPLFPKAFEYSTLSKIYSSKKRITNNWWLTYDLHFVGGIDLSRSVGDVAGVLPTVLRRQVLQTQSPLLLLPFPSSSCSTTFFVHKRPAVLQPHNVGARVTTCCTLQTHWAAHWASDDALPHLWRLGETWTYCDWRDGGERENCNCN